VIYLALAGPWLAIGLLLAMQAVERQMLGDDRDAAGRTEGLGQSSPRDP
jgi:hypothetical protein